MLDDDEGAGMSDRFAGRVAVVTGGSSGIGWETARSFAREGAVVVVADLSEGGATELAGEFGDRVHFHRTDVSAESEVEALFDGAVERFGRVDIAFANAGIIPKPSPLAALDMGAAAAVIGVNLVGVLHCFKHAARVMEGQGSGAILATSSPSALRGGIAPHVYGATKSAVIALVQSAAAELRASGVRVNAIIPGSVLTPMTAEIHTGDRRGLAEAEERMRTRSGWGAPGAPADIASAALYLASDEARFVTGISMPVDGGYLAAGSAGAARS
jgi:NAD(P)-dependent dehydrogenase (short-subunit alcohol dehydrogenase family)